MKYNVPDEIFTTLVSCLNNQYRYKHNSSIIIESLSIYDSEKDSAALGDQAELFPIGSILYKVVVGNDGILIHALGNTIPNAIANAYKEVDNLRVVSKNKQEKAPVSPIDSNDSEQEDLVLDYNQIDYAVRRFLSYKLPETFNPDGCIQFRPSPYLSTWPTGTNLLTYSETADMVRYMLHGMPKNYNDGEAKMDEMMLGLQEFAPDLVDELSRRVETVQKLKDSIERLNNDS